MNCILNAISTMIASVLFFVLNRWPARLLVPMLIPGVAIVVDKDFLYGFNDLGIASGSRSLLCPMCGGSTMSVSARHTSVYRSKKTDMSIIRVYQCGSIPIAGTHDGRIYFKRSDQCKTTVEVLESKEDII